MINIIKDLQSVRNLRRVRRSWGCQVYLSGDKVFAVPSVFGITEFREGWQELIIPVSKPNEAGEAIMSALTLSRHIQNRTKPTNDWLSGSEGYLEKMEEFRSRVCIGKRRFERDIKLVSIRQTRNETELTTMRRVHGRFAFEAASESCQKPVILEPHPVPRALAEQVMTLL